jgi:hypothetical protein
VRHGVGCVTCHGRVDQMARVYQVESLRMDWCLDCHRDPEKRLRPLAEVTDMSRTSEDADVSLAVARDLGVRRLTHCSTCHR